MTNTSTPRLETLEARQLFSASGSSVQILPTLGDKAEYTTVAVNPLTQRPAVAYYDTTHHDLKYLEDTGKKWVSSTVDAPGNVGLEPSLQFDKSGEPWIAYYDATHHDLKIAHEVKSTWQIQPVDSFESEGRYLSLALTKAGTPVIAYYGNTSAKGAGLKLATLTTNGWQIQTIASDPDPVDDGAPGEFCSLALDGHDRPRIAFADHYANLDYASTNGHMWDIQTLENNGSQFGNTVFGTKLLLDSAGEPHIAYNIYPANDGGETDYATYSGKGWNFQEADSQALPGAGLDDSTSIGMVLSAKGQPTIAYLVIEGFNTSPADDQLAIAVPASSAAPAAFNDTVIDSSKHVAGYVSMAENFSDTLFVAYTDLDGMLKFYRTN